MNMKKLLFLAVAPLLMTPLAHAQLGTNQVTDQVNVNVAAESALSIAAAPTTLTSAGFNFSNYTGSTPFTYFIRSTKVGGTGLITLEVTSDFAGTGGPSVANSGATGDTLSYVSTVSTPGTPVNGTASTSAETNVATFGADAHSAKTGNSSSVAWTLINDPQYQTGSYQATVRFTISVT
jgi:hypothetical protein